MTIEVMAIGRHATAGDVHEGSRYRLRVLTIPMLVPACAPFGEDHLTLPVTIPPLGESDEEQLYWFRWITGHQAAFGVWHLLGRAVDSLARDLTVGAIETAVLCTQAYSSLIVYCGSMSRDLYARSMRPAMARHHPAFSGAWSRDYALVDSTASTLCRAAKDDALLRGYVKAREQGARIHMAVAQRLVPDKTSLLGNHVRATAGDLPAQGEAAALFDSFFFTRRAAVPFSTVCEQLHDRLDAILGDLQEHDLFVAEYLGEPEMVALQGGAFTMVRTSIWSTLSRVRAIARARSSDGRAAAV